MCKMIAIAGQKGGSGKSTTAVNLAASLALLEKRTLLVDCDPSGCSTAFSGLKETIPKHDVGDILFGKINPSKAVFETQLKFMKVMPAGFNLFFAASKAVRRKGNEKLLRLFLKELKGDYDYIIIDSPSSFSFTAVTALAASDWLVVPLQCRARVMEEFSLLLKMVKHIRNSCQVRLRIAGLVFTMVSSRQEVDAFLTQEMTGGISNIVYDAFIPDDNAIRLACESGKPSALYDIESIGSKAYLRFADELISFF